MKNKLPFLILILIFTVSGCGDVSKLGKKLKTEAKPYCATKSITEFQRNSSKYKKKLVEKKFIGTRYVKKADGGMKCYKSLVDEDIMNCKPTYSKVKERYTYYEMVDINKPNRTDWMRQCMKKQCASLAIKLNGEEKDIYKDKSKRVLTYCH